MLPSSLLAGLRSLHDTFRQSGSCTIYQRTDTKDAMGIAVITYTTTRAGNTYPLSCKLQEIDRMPKTHEAGEKITQVGEYNLKLGWNVAVENNDRIIVTDETGREITLEVVQIFRRTERISTLAYCREVVQ